MKKILSILLALILCLGALISCGNEENSSSQSETKSESSSESVVQSESTGEESKSEISSETQSETILDDNVLNNITRITYLGNVAVIIVSVLVSGTRKAGY